MAPGEKIGIVGDLHQEDDRLALLLAYFEAEGVTNVLCVGDLADGVGDLHRCIELLKASAVHCVLGNHDRWLLRGTMRDLPDALPTSMLRDEDRSYLTALPRTLTFDTSWGELLVCHGMGDDDMGELRPEDEGYALESNYEMQELVRGRRYGFVVAGHTHQVMVRRIGETWFVNPGTLRRDHGATSALLDPETRTVSLLDIEPSAVLVHQRVKLG
jgi:putative phosphoesterase